MDSKNVTTKVNIQNANLVLLVTEKFKTTPFKKIQGVSDHLALVQFNGIFRKITRIV